MDIPPDLEIAGLRLWIHGGDSGDTLGGRPRLSFMTTSIRRRGSSRIWTAAAAIGGAAGFVATVAGLQAVQPEHDAFDRMISELATGRYGWAASFAFAHIAEAGKHRADVRTTQLLILGGSAALLAGVLVVRILLARRAG